MKSKSSTTTNRKKETKPTFRKGRPLKYTIGKKDAGKPCTVAENGMDTSSDFVVAKRGAVSAWSGNKLPLVHPGKILMEKFMKPNELSANKVAAMLDVSPTCVGEIIKGDRAITANTAVRLARCFGTSAQFWLNLQTQYELEKVEDANLSEIKRVVKVFKPANAY